MAIMRYDTVLDGLLKLFSETLPTTLKAYRDEIERIKTDYASADAAKVAVEKEIEAHRARLAGYVDTEMKQATSRKQTLETSISTLEKERDDLLKQVDGVRATIQAARDETAKLVHEREMALHDLQAQIDAATARHQTIRADIDAVLRKHGGST